METCPSLREINFSGIISFILDLLSIINIIMLELCIVYILYYYYFPINCWIQLNRSLSVFEGIIILIIFLIFVHFGPSLYRRFVSHLRLFLSRNSSGVFYLKHPINRWVQFNRSLSDSWRNNRPHYLFYICPFWTFPL